MGELEFEDICIDFLDVMTGDRFEFDLYLSMECKEFDEAPKCLDGIYKEPGDGRQLFQDFKDLIGGEIDSGAKRVLSRLDKIDNNILASLIRILVDDKELKNSWRRLKHTTSFSQFVYPLSGSITVKGPWTDIFVQMKISGNASCLISNHTPFTHHIKEYLSDIGINRAGKILNPLLDDLIEKENDLVYLTGSMYSYSIYQ